MSAISNLHTHTSLCRHATGRAVDYFNQAKKDGCSALGFSDHCPFPDSVSDFWPQSRMAVSDAPQYRDEVLALKKDSPFPVYLGFECEWEASCVSWYKDFLMGEMGAEYLVLGSHWVTLGDHHIYIINEVEKQDLYRYTDQTIQGMESGLFAFLAHPDVLMGHGRRWDSDVEACMKSIIACAKSLDLPVEVNGYGMHKEMYPTEKGMRYAYPVDEFWSMAAAEGLRVLCNSDAHDPAIVISQAQDARRYAQKFGIIPEENVLAGLIPNSSSSR